LEVIGMNREEWLMAGVEKIRPLYRVCNLEIPKNVLVSVGFPPTGGLTGTKGVCFSKEVSPTGARNIFISPLEADPIIVLGILSHELVHSALRHSAGHGKPFKGAMMQVGLEGEPKHCLPGKELASKLARIYEELGDYPHAGLVIPPKTPKTAKGTFRLFCLEMRYCENGTSECRNEEEKQTDYTISVGKKTLEIGFPKCPCGIDLVMEQDDWEIYKRLIEDEN
jgi:hypothetical protein